MRYSSVKNNPDWVRENSSGALIFNNQAKIQEYQSKHKQKQKIESLETDINNIKEEINTMKGLLTEILERL